MSFRIFFTLILFSVFCFATNCDASNRTQTKQCNGSIAMLAASEGMAMIGASIFGENFAKISLPMLHNQYVKHFSCILSVVREPKKADQNSATGEIFFSDVNGVNYNTYDENAVNDTKSNFLTICNRFPPFQDLNLLKNTPQNAQNIFLDKLYKKKIIPEEEYDLAQFGNQIKNDRYKYILATAGKLECKTGKANDKLIINNIKYRIFEKGNGICASMYGINNLNWIEENIGCHASIHQSSGSSRECSDALAIRDDSESSYGRKIPGTGTGNIIGYDNKSCYKDCNIADACINSVNNFSLVQNSITAPIMQCLKESLHIALTGDMTQGSDDPKCKTGGLLYNMQKKLRKTVMAILTLAVAFFSLKAMMSGTVEKKDFFIFILKITFIIYFTMPSINNGADYWYRQIGKMRDGIMSIVTNAVGNKTICKFRPDEYKQNIGGKMLDFSYLQLWDQIDCRLLAYLGGNGILVIKKNINDPEVGLRIAYYLQNLFLGFDIFLALLMLFFTAMFIAVAIWVLGVYLICMIVFALLMFLSPIFIPMILFQYTKQTFDSWLKEVIAFSIFPIIVFLFIGYGLKIIDDLFVGDTQFEENYYTQNINGTDYKRKRFVYDEDITSTINKIDSNILSSSANNLSATDEQKLRQTMYEEMYKADRGALYNPKTLKQQDIDDFIKKNDFSNDYDEFLEQFKVKMIGERNGKLAIRMIGMGNYWKKDSILGEFKYKSLKRPTPEDSMKIYGTEDAFGLSFVMDILIGTFFLTLFLNFLSISGGIAGELAGGSRAVIEAGNPEGIAKMLGKVTGFAWNTTKTGLRPMGRLMKKGAGKIAKPMGQKAKQAGNAIKEKSSSAANAIKDSINSMLK